MLKASRIQTLAQIFGSPKPKVHTLHWPRKFAKPPAHDGKETTAKMPSSTGNQFFGPGMTWPKRANGLSPVKVM